MRKGVASRGELTGAMGATIQTVRKHEMQIQAMLEGIKQLMDGQAALGEAFKSLEQRFEDGEISPIKVRLNALIAESLTSPLELKQRCEVCGQRGCTMHHLVDADA